MPVRVLLAVTDYDWADQLSRLPALDEVNFWSPSAQPFSAIEPGELFLFKLHAPHNMICGGGVFAHATTMPCSLAWATFREANGARDSDEMRARIARYRRVGVDDTSDFVIGCRILTQPSFWPRELWLPTPPGWAREIVRFKRFGTDAAEGRSLWEEATERMSLIASARGSDLAPRAPAGVAAPTPPRYGTPTLVAPRLGQGAFRVVIADAYGRRCAMTRERTLPALEAAHIQPYAEGGRHDARNGLLLRRDLHGLFDSGYVTVLPDLRVEVSRRIREEFENGREYYALHGRPLEAPANPQWRPDPAALAWHNDKRFRG